MFYLLSSGCTSGPKDNDTFSMAFMTDIHLQPEGNSAKGLSQALDSVNRLKPDFMITGGDLIMDGLEQTFGRTDSLYRLYQETMRRAECPVYNTMGNHDIYGICRKIDRDTLNPEYGEKMFANRFGKPYYSFEHKGWKFMILNSIEARRIGCYVGEVDSAQMSWIKDELKNTDPATPIVISTHIPFITIYSQLYEGSTKANNSSLVVYNSKEVLDLFRGYNLKLVLQGHLHTREDIFAGGIYFITGGAVSAAWWGGPHMGTEEGFLHVTFGRDSFRWRYVDYGWNAGK
jgi:3',5'-cyclic AMP phosphodiesterase CpdA